MGGADALCEGMGIMLRNRQRDWMLWLLTLSVTAPAFGSDAGDVSLFGRFGDFILAISTLVIFGLVVVVLGRFAWGPLLSALQRREKFIRDSLESAKDDRDKAAALLAEYKEQLEKARDEATAMVEEGRRDAAEVRRRLEAEARQAAEQISERAKRDIGIARDTVLRELHEESARLAMLMASEVLKRQVTEDDHDRLLQDALDQLRQRGMGTN
jgi:F-type H+-transporting ATPase subunit b